MRQIQKSLMIPQCCQMLCTLHMSRSQTQKRSPSGSQSCICWHDSLYLLKTSVASDSTFLLTIHASGGCLTGDVERLREVVHQERSTAQDSLWKVSISQSARRMGVFYYAVVSTSWCLIPAIDVDCKHKLPKLSVPYASLSEGVQ